MERVAEPHTMKRILGTLPHGPSRFVRAPYRFAQWVGDVIDPWILHKLH
jgi:hypothetical protein